MTIPYTAPAYITFTGVDRADLLPGMLALSARYPIEWGVLLDAAQEGAPLFPLASVRDALQAAPLRLSAHICGGAAQAIVQGGDPELNLAGFSRVQINHARAGSSDSEIRNSASFAARHGVRSALQCQGEFPADLRADWLYDVSFGTGVRPTTWPATPAGLPFCGYSGGLGPDTVRDMLPKFAIAAGAAYWIDMESGVRTEGRFDLAKCEAVCRIVFDELPRIAA
ncbi:phosphoribosylanthranilate isomerase [Duganella sp. FT50W]|uniref:Phosphoribosylanthranilate isomerase n=1 Tax=Duganella lactea TaxID=2692173 RepID=A0A6L8MLW8_9BURK|nr:phosphoribosylanthranilate isomerase [Duganella lactea]MYM83659.1 phosphoribosylanthranilate isomerase [Duganella lactea]